MAAEIMATGTGKTVVFSASMGPQLIGCGDERVAKYKAEKLAAASMGPQLIGCGD